MLKARDCLTFRPVLSQPLRHWAKRTATGEKNIRPVISNVTPCSRRLRRPTPGLPPWLSLASPPGAVTHKDYATAPQESLRETLCLKWTNVRPLPRSLGDKRHFRPPKIAVGHLHHQAVSHTFLFLCFLLFLGN